MTARRATAYPQVDPGAAALADHVAIPLPRAATVERALALARRRDAIALVVADGEVVLRDDLVRARDLGLETLAASALSRPVPSVDAAASEVAVRRAVASGAPVVLVRARGGATRVVVPDGDTDPTLGGASMARHVARRPGARRALLETVGRLATASGARAWLAAGVVRDMLRGARDEARDVDVVVEGDAPELARQLGRETGGRVVVHARFLTASVDVPGAGTIDLTTARSERYDARGALPRVLPAGLRADLVRRDFTVNAMAIELTGVERTLVDPFGGRTDLERRRLTVLHPLSFVEDPTRMFRAARYAARLGFSLDPWSRRCRRLAIALTPYPALSGQRLIAELALIADDRRPDVALADLGRAGAFRLLDARYRFTRETRAAVEALPETLAWAAGAGLAPVRVDLVLLILLGDQRLEVAQAVLRRLAVTGEPLARMERALATRAAALDAVVGAPTPSARARVLAGRTAAELAWLRLVAGPGGRATVDWWVRTGRTIEPELRGDDLADLGVPRGPAMSRILDALRTARLDGVVAGRAAESDYVRGFLTNEREG